MGMGAVRNSISMIVLQELIARTHFRGVIRKRLVPFVLSEPSPGDGDGDGTSAPFCTMLPRHGLDLSWKHEALDRGTAVLHGGKKAGKVLSCRGNVGMAMVRTEALFHAQHVLRVQDYILHPIIPSWWVDDTPL